MLSARLAVLLLLTGVLFSAVQSQDPMEPQNWYTYFFGTSQQTTLTLDGYYYNVTQSMANETLSNTNSVTTFYWTSFRQTFSGYWGDDYDTSDAVIVEEISSIVEEDAAPFLSVHPALAALPLCFVFFTLLRWEAIYC